MNKTELEKAYKMVFDDLVNNGSGLFVGKYDARNGIDNFMYGICTVMESIACRVDEKTYFEFSDMFAKNMIESQKKI